MNVEVRVIDNRKGKGLFAKKNFKAGDTIFEEDPLVCCQFAWNEQYGYEACDHCMRPLETAEENAKRLTNKWNLVLPYPQCCDVQKANIVECAACGVKYCSEACRVLAFQQYHRTICIQTKERDFAHPLEKLTESWKEMHFPPETCNIMLLVRILAIVQQSPNRTEAMQQFMQFCHRTVNEDADLAHKLVGEPFVCQINLMMQLVQQAMTLDGVEHWFTPEGFRSLMALIGTNGQGVGTSAISVWVKNSSNLPLSDQERAELDKFIDTLYEDLEKESGTFLNNEGSALYALQSACNHSCLPNAQPNFLHNNFQLSMVTLKDIQAGEEITISYLDECVLNRSRHSRQTFLAENYMFVCDCPKCQSQADDPDVTSEEEMSDSE
ncbi:SET and MYND domain containing class 5 [Carabus blaptoides fortunei]